MKYLSGCIAAEATLVRLGCSKDIVSFHVHTLAPHSRRQDIPHHTVQGMGRAGVSPIVVKGFISPHLQILLLIELFYLRCQCHSYFIYFLCSLADSETDSRHLHIRCQTASMCSSRACSLYATKEGHFITNASSALFRNVGNASGAFRLTCERAPVLKGCPPISP